MKDAPEFYDIGAGSYWLNAAGRSLALAATLGLGLLGGYLPHMLSKQPETTNFGREKIDHVEVVGGIEYKLTEKASAYFAHGFHRMKLCGATFTQEQRDEIYHTADYNKDTIINKNEAGDTFVTILNPQDEEGMKMIPLEKRVQNPTPADYPDWAALLRSTKHKEFLDLIAR